MGVVRPGANPYALLQLPQSCTQLWVGGEAFIDDTAIAVAQLTQLKRLTWTESPWFSDFGLKQLTALDLDELCVESCALGPDLAEHYVWDIFGGLKVNRHPQKVSVASWIR